MDFFVNYAVDKDMEYIGCRRTNKNSSDDFISHWMKNSAPDRFQKLSPTDDRPELLEPGHAEHGFYPVEVFAGIFPALKAQQC